VLCGITGVTTWDFYVLGQCIKPHKHGLVDAMGSGQLFDMHALHMYTACSEHVPNALGE